MIPAVAGIAAFGPATAAALLIAIYLLVGEPVTGLVLHRRFESALRRSPTARVWLYQRLLILEWGLVAFVAGVVLVAPGVGWAELGLALPTGVAAALTLALAVALLVAVGWGTRAVRTAAARGEQLPVSASPSVLSLVPRTSAERRWFAAVAVTAGCCEELLYRGFLLAVLTALVPGTPTWVLVLVGGAVFGLAHAYQGASGMLVTGVVGVVLAALYALTGSLLLPILVHAAIDLRILWLPAAALVRQQESG